MGVLQLYLLIFASPLLLIKGFPLDDVAVTRNEELKLKGRSQDVPSHILEMEHREGKKGSIKDVFDKMLSSRTVSAVDNLASSVVKLASGVVVDVGDFLVDQIDHLPQSIKVVSDVVGTAVDKKREKVTAIMKSTNLQQPLNEASEKIGAAVEKSELQSSIKSIEDSLASLLGKFIGATYKNADSISNAISSGIQRITKPSEKSTSIDDLPILSRSLKENEIKISS